MSGSVNKPFNDRYLAFHWERAAGAFQKWCQGETGFPIVDAGQRQMNETGYMHNRVRMCSASFLTKELHISWTEGERYFATRLVDYSPMQNNGGWQWASSTGSSAQPYYQMFNPWVQASKFDPDCAYVKQWIPELKDVPAADILRWYDPKIRKKWLDEEGVAYFDPMVDHEKERKKTFAAYKAV